MSSQSSPCPRPRSRVLLALALAATVCLGLLSRSPAMIQPFLRAHAGDALWALMVYLGIAFLAPQASVARLAVGAAAFCLVIELSQLSMHPVLVAARETRLGALVLGHGFLASDLVRYAAGILLGAGIDGCRAIRRARDLTISAS